MNEQRFQENKENRLSISTPTKDDPTLVCCLKCQSKAVVTLHDDEARLSCSVVKSKKNTVDARMINGERKFSWLSIRQDAFNAP